MHTIDLLRGQGIPAKTTLGSLLMIIVIVAVPILAAAWMVDRYIQDDTEIGISQAKIDKAQETIKQFAGAVKSREALLNQQKTVRGKLSEVSSYIGRHIQWSPVLITLVENMPRGMVMNALKADSTIERQKVAGENDPKSTIKRKLIIDISGTDRRDYNDDIEKYSKSLKSSPELGSKLEKIEFSQKPGTSGDINTVSYTMNLLFKPGTL